MKTYFFCSLRDYPNVAFESVDESTGEMLFHNQIGDIINVIDIEDLYYLNRSWVPDDERLSWMDGGVTKLIDTLTDLKDVKPYNIQNKNQVLSINNNGTSTIWKTIDIENILLKLTKLEKILGLDSKTNIKPNTTQTYINNWIKNNSYDDYRNTHAFIGGISVNSLPWQKKSSFPDYVR